MLLALLRGDNCHKYEIRNVQVIVEKNRNNKTG
jgi:hypothetical protein